MDLDKLNRRQHFSPQPENSSDYPKVTIETEESKEDDISEEKEVSLESEKEIYNGGNENKIYNSQEEDTVEQINPSNVTVEREKIDDETINNAGGMNTVKYRTKDVANILDVTEQTVRNNAAFFEQYLNIEKKTSGHRRYTKESIDKLRLIFQLKNEKKFTNEQVIEYLQGDSTDYTSLSPEKKLDMVLMMVSQTVTQVMEETAEKITQSSQKMIDQQNDTYTENLKQNTELIKQLSEKLSQKEDAISLLKEDKEELLRQNEEFKRQLLEIQKQTSDSQSQIIEELEKLKEQPQKKRWSFWK